MTETLSDTRREAALAADLAALEKLAAEMTEPRDQIPSDPPAPPEPAPPPVPQETPLGDPIPPAPPAPPPLPDPAPPPVAFAEEIAELERLVLAIEAARSAAGGDIPMPPGTPPGDLPPQPVPMPEPDPSPGPMPDPGPAPDQTPGPQMGQAPLPDTETLAAQIALIAAEVAGLKLKLADLARPEPAPKSDPARDIAAITTWVETLATHWPAHLEPPNALKTLVFGAGLVRGMLPPEALASEALAPRPSIDPQTTGVGPGAVPTVSPAAAAVGRAAGSPVAIPAAGWQLIAARVWAEVWEDRVPAVAAGVAFYALLALFPAITALVSIFGLFADRAIVLSNLAQLDHLIPAPALELIRVQIDALLATDPATLTFATALGLALALWTANGGMKAMIEALNVAYGERERRNLVILNLWSLAMTLGGIAMVVVILGLSAVLPPLLARLPTELGTDRWMLALRWPVMLGLLIGVLALLYRFGPSRHGAKWRWIGPGTLIAAGLLIVASMGFSIYTANFASYNETYGSLGAVVALMVWVWISAMIVLLGAEINSEAERQTAVDTTTGRPRAMGQRGAFAADTLGE